MHSLCKCLTRCHSNFWYLNGVVGLSSHCYVVTSDCFFPTRSNQPRAAATDLRVLATRSAANSNTSVRLTRHSSADETNTLQKSLGSKRSLDVMFLTISIPSYFSSSFPFLFFFFLYFRHRLDLTPSNTLLLYLLLSSYFSLLLFLCSIYLL